MHSHAEFCSSEDAAFYFAPRPEIAIQNERTFYSTETGGRKGCQTIYELTVATEFVVTKSEHFLPYT